MLNSLSGYIPYGDQLNERQIEYLKTKSDYVFEQIDEVTLKITKKPDEDKVPHSDLVNMMNLPKYLDTLDHFRGEDKELPLLGRSQFFILFNGCYYYPETEYQNYNK